MVCYLCGSKDYIQILNKPEIFIWNNSGDKAGLKERYKCVLLQCVKCGHVYEPLEPALKNILEKVYQSEHAQASTTVGMGNWGKERAMPILQALSSFANCSSVLEIGCSDGFVLKYLRSKGVSRLVGIEPSLSSSHEEEGIYFIKAFADSSLQLAETFEVIIALSVFEHLEDIHNVMTFCRTHLQSGGVLFFTVPSARKFLQQGEPGLFLHQHVHYYTEALLRRLLQEHRFTIQTLQSNNDMLLVTASLAKTTSPYLSSTCELYRIYAERLALVLNRARQVLSEDHVIVHGANSPLNNILGWLSQDFDFTLVDNDVTKQNQLFFSRRVHSFQEIDLSQYKSLFISTATFFESICNQYRRAGFKGSIQGT